MKRTIILVLILCLAMSGMTGCAQEQKTDGISVVAVIFPEYDWARQIIGNESGGQLHLLVDDGVDPHSFQPTVADMVTVSECDLLIYGGGESDSWLEDVLKKPSNKKMRTVALLPLLGEKAYTEEIAVSYTHLRAHETS